ncbi:MAG: hypothetical protein J5526_04615 [Bacteroidales bacterium]|nr:hypothetical protein [Bacteroidales bacterium]
MKRNIGSCPQLMDYIQQVGFLPLLYSGIDGFSAEESVSSKCRYHVLPDGGWEWPLWKWKGPIITESDCVYGKFFDKKAGFISRRWWPDFCNYRRSLYPAPPADSIEDTILEVLRVNGSMITRDLRAACGFNGPKMRSRFDAYVTRLQMACRIVTEDFVYPRDRHDRPYGWGWSLLTTPEQLMHADSVVCSHSPQESYNLISSHLKTIIPGVSDRQLRMVIG